MFDFVMKNADTAVFLNSIIKKVLLLKSYRRLLQQLKNGHINGVLNSQLTKQR